MTHFCKRATAALAMLLLWGGAARAGTRSMFGVAGALQPLPGQGRHIRLVEHEVRVQLPQRRVEARSVLRNDGPATTVAIGLPESGIGEPVPSLGRGFLSGHQSFVDGRRVAVSKYLPDGEPGEDGYHLLWQRRVRFERGQTRVLRDVYSMGAASEMQNAPEAGYRRLFSYGLSGAAKWKGRVGRVRAVFDVAGLREFSPVSFDFSGSKPGPERRGDLIVWEKRDFEPQGDLGASWWPGVRDFEVNGREAFPRCVVVGRTPQLGEYRAVYPQKRGGRIWVPLRLLKEWLPEAPEGESNGIAPGARNGARGLSWGRLSITVEIGSRWIDAYGPKVQKRVAMPAPAWEASGVTMVELESAVRALGGATRRDASRGRVAIQL